MNLILLHPEDLTGPDRVRLTGRRLFHVRSVHEASAGDVLSVGLLNGRLGRGRITRIDDDVLEMTVELDRDPPLPVPVTVVLALPRPKVLRRVLFALTVLGVKRIILVNSARVEKSYWQTPYLGDAAVRRQLVLGLEQACDTLLPEVLLRKRFRPFVEDELPVLVKGTLALVAHPHVPTPWPPHFPGPVTLAIGPEGGFVPYEIDLLSAVGFHAVQAGPRILNVETAVPFLISRLIQP